MATANMLARLRAFLGTDQSGVAAVEFALVLPVMLLFSLGIAEVGRFALLTLKLQHAATTMADLASRDDEIGDASVPPLFGAMAHVVQPFDLADQGVVILSAVIADGGDPPSVCRQWRGAGGLGETSRIGSQAGAATLPDDLSLRADESVIVAEVMFRYQPWLLGLVPETLLRRVAFFRPRLATPCA